MVPPVPKILIVTAAFNEQEALPAYVRAVKEILLSRTDCQFEVLLIDDGSTDKTWTSIQAIAATDDRFEGIRLSRNYGANIAEYAGFVRADADAVVTLACDLQDPPETVLEFLQQWRQGAKIVWGKRRTRQDAPWRVATSRFFHRLMQRFAMPKESKFCTGGFFLLDRRVVSAVCQFHEQNRVNFALVAWTGFEQAVVEYDRRKRVAGKSGWNLGRMLKTTYDAFIGFSYLPIRVMTLTGLAVSLFAFLLSLFLFYNWLMHQTMPGWSSIALGLSVFFGIQFLLTGISGEYLYRIYLEVVRRPLYFISETTKKR
jgi:dolichol-phosphate mannosyltransferase